MKQTYFKFFFALLLFGSNGIVAKTISLSSYEIVLFRTLLGSLLLVSIFVLSHQKLTSFQGGYDFFFLAVSGAAMGASWIFLFEAYRQIGVGIATLAYYCGPVIVMALSPLLFQEKLTWPKVTGFVAVLCGIILVNERLVSEGNTFFGLFCGFMSAIMFAIMIIFNKKARRIQGLENSMLQLLFSFLVVASFVGCKQGFAMQIVHTDWLPILILGLVNTGLGCYLYFSAIGKLPVQTVAICGYLDPLSAVAFSVLILKESLQPLQILGAILILGGAIFGEFAAKIMDTLLTKQEREGEHDANIN